MLIYTVLTLFFLQIFLPHWSVLLAGPVRQNSVTFLPTLSVRGGGDDTPDYRGK